MRPGKGTVYTLVQIHKHMAGWGRENGHYTPLFNYIRKSSSSRTLQHSTINLVCPLSMDPSTMLPSSREKSFFTEYEIGGKQQCRLDDVYILMQKWLGEPFCCYPSWFGENCKSFQSIFPVLWAKHLIHLYKGRIWGLYMGVCEQNPLAPSMSSIFN